MGNAMRWAFLVATAAIPAGLAACSSSPGQTIVIVEQADAGVAAAHDGAADVDAAVDAGSDASSDLDAGDADAGPVEAACEPPIDLPVGDNCLVFYNDCSNSNQCGNTTSYLCNVGTRPGVDGCNVMPNSPYPDAETQYCCRPTCLRDPQADIGCGDAGEGGHKAYNCPRVDAYNDDAGLRAPLPSPACTFHAHGDQDIRFNETVCCP